MKVTDEDALGICDPGLVLATTIGGSTPAIVPYLIHETGNRAMPGAWLSVAAALAFVTATLALPQKATAQDAAAAMS